MLPGELVFICSKTNAALEKSSIAHLLMVMDDYLILWLSKNPTYTKIDGGSTRDF